MKVIILQSFGDQAVLTSLPVFVTMLSRIEHAESIADTFDEMTAVRIQYWKVFVLSYLNVIARMYYIDDLEYLIKQYYQKLNTCEDLELNLEDDILRWKEVVPTPASDEVEEEKANEITEDEAVFVANPAFATRTKPPSASSSRPTANATAESHSTEPNKDVVKLSINDIKRKLMTCHIFQAYSFEINKAFEMEFIPFDASHSMLRDTMVLVAHGEDSQFASLDQFKPTSRTLFGDEHDHHSETGSVVSRGSNASSRVSKRSRTSSKSNKTKVNLPNHHHHHNLKHNYTEGYTILSSKLMTDSSCLDDVSTSIATEKTADSTQASNGNNSLLYPVLPPHIRTHAWRETFFRTNAHIHVSIQHCHLSFSICFI